MPKRPADIRSLARGYTDVCVKTLGGWATAEEGVDDDIKIRAIGMLLDRGWGKPNQPVTGEDGEGPLIVEIINRAREKK